MSKKNKPSSGKKPVNLTLSGEAKKMAKDLMERDQRGSLSNLVESLIAKAHRQMTEPSAQAA